MTFLNLLIKIVLQGFSYRNTSFSRKVFFNSNDKYCQLDFYVTKPHVRIALHLRDRDRDRGIKH